MDHKKLSNRGSRASTARVLVLSMAALAFAGAAFGQSNCRNLSRNVLRFENCGFDSGIWSWVPLTGVNPRFNRDEGTPSRGSYQMESIDDVEGDRVTTIRSPCIPIAPSSTYEVEAYFKIVDSSDEVGCGFFVAGFLDGRCFVDPNGRDSAEIRVSGTSWVSLSDTFVSRPGDSSMAIFAFCFEDASGPMFTMLMDNFVAEGPTSRSPIFSNGFESGDTSAWSRTVR